MFTEEIITLLQEKSVGVFGTNLFGSTMAELPTAVGTYLSVIETGGTTPLRTHNSIVVPALVRPSAQLVARAGSFLLARNFSRLAYGALVGTRNRFVNSFPIPVTITRLGAVATATTATPHGLLTNQKGIIAGAGQVEYNGEFTITVTGASTFTFPVGGTPATPATGTITFTPKTWYLEINPRQEPFDMTLDSSGRARVGFNIDAVKGPS